MSSQHVFDDLPAFVSGNLGEEAGGRIRVHLESCETCREDFRSMNALWDSLGRLPEAKPDQTVRIRFYDMLKSYQGGDFRTVSRPRASKEGWIRKLFPMQPAFQLAFGLAAVAAGMVAGYRLKSDHVDGTELAQLHDEVRGMGRLLTISLLQQESASERLRGVTWSYRAGGYDAEITAALLQTLRYDPNVNVRLAALDALSPNLNQSDLRQDLIHSLPKQSSPLVQAAIVDMMIQVHETASLATFRQMVRDPNLNPSVKKKIEQGIQKLI